MLARELAIVLRSRITWIAAALASLLVQTAAPARLLAAKTLAALAGVGLQLAVPIALLALFLALGGHLAFAETAVALLAHALYLAFVVCLAISAAAFTASLAQAA